MKDFSSTEVMGLCVAMINKELAKQAKLVESKIPSNLLTDSSLRSVEERFDRKLKEVDESSIKSLPDGIVFDVHLQDAIQASGKVFERVVDDINSTYSELYEKLSRKLTLASNNHIELTEQYSQYKENLHYILESLEQADESAKGQLVELFSADEEIRSSISLLSQQLNASLQDSVDKINKGLFDLGSEFDQNKKLSESKISELTSDILSVSKDIVQVEDTLKSELSSNTLLLAGDIKSLSDQLNSTNDSVSLLGTELRGDITRAVGKLESEYSKIGHDHSQYANVSDLTALESKQKDQSEALKTQASVIADVINDVKSKIDIKDGLTKSDLESVKQDIADKVEARIPTPSDGKDALNWEFKFDDREVGVLMFRREDQTRWQRQNIRGPRGLQGMAGSGYGGMGGGGVTTLQGNFNLEIEKDGEVLNSEAKKINFVGDGLDVIPSDDGVIVKVSDSILSQGFLKDKIPLSNTVFEIDIAELGYTDYYSFRIVDSNAREVDLAVTELDLKFRVESLFDMTGLFLEVRGFK